MKGLSYATKIYKCFRFQNHSMRWNNTFPVISLHVFKLIDVTGIRLTSLWTINSLQFKVFYAKLFHKLMLKNPKSSNCLTSGVTILIQLLDLFQGQGPLFLWSKTHAPKLFTTTFIWMLMLHQSISSKDRSLQAAWLSNIKRQTDVAYGSILMRDAV